MEPNEVASSLFLPVHEPKLPHLSGSINRLLFTLVNQARPCRKSGKACAGRFRRTGVQ